MYLLRDELSYACVSMGNAIDLMTNKKNQKLKHKRNNYLIKPTIKYKKKKTHFLQTKTSKHLVEKKDKVNIYKTKKNKLYNIFPLAHSTKWNALSSFYFLLICH